MKAIHPSYTFVASTKTITLTGLNIDQDQLLLIVNATRGVQYFNFADSSLRGTVTSGANTTVVLTDASTTGHANGDALVIYYDDQTTSQVVSGTVTANPGTGAFTVSGTVGLDAASLVALENITVTIGSSVSISNFPATQTIAGTVTANGGNFAYAQDEDTSEPDDKGVLIGWREDANGAFRNVSDAQPLPISGTVTVGNTVTIAGTVTANPTGTQTIAGTVTVGYITDAKFISSGGGELPDRAVAIGFYKDPIDNFVQVEKALGYGLPVEFNNSVTIGSLPAISGTVTVSSLPASTVTVSSLPVISGTVTVGNSVTIGSLPTLTPQLPRVTFIDGSGTVTTANTAVTVFASSTTRSYLLVQVTTGSAFVNVGATATTVNGISLTAGQGYAWETTIPQGAVSLISTTTSSRWVAKEA